jgi:AcrR family transcriptional regulator
MTPPKVAGVPAAAAKPTRRTQEERRNATRGALLDATVDCLVEFGYAGVTTTRICDCAGVSRGAQVHHFPTKADLVGEAVAHLAERRATELRSELEHVPKGKRRAQAALDLLWHAFSGPLFQASLELMVAARTDPDLREHLFALERRVNDLILQGADDLFDDLAERPGFHGDFEMALATMRGLALMSAVSGGERKGVQRAWTESRKRLLALLDAAPAASPASNQENERN